LAACSGADDLAVRHGDVVDDAPDSPLNRFDDDRKLADKTDDVYVSDLNYTCLGWVASTLE
jgi:hypothetical protein